jgi:4-amino-4-deoxy-L-arabinose transferase-like glycosyltransferase
VTASRIIAGWGKRHFGALLLLVFCLALYVPGLVALPPTDRDEARFAQASRQMLESGDFVDIRFQEESRYNKPIGIYWLQAASAALSDDAGRIWPYRLPSLIGAIVAVFLTVRVGSVLFDRRTGLIGAAMLAGSALLAVEARLATTDAVLLAAICLAQLVLAMTYLAARRGEGIGLWPALLFWAALGAGVLLKGPLIVLVTGTTVLTLSLLDRDFRWLRSLRPLVGVPLACAIVLPWLIAIAGISGTAFFHDSLGQDLFSKITAGRESHGAPPGWYLAMFPVCFWPFSLLVVLTLPWVWRNRHDPSVRFCLAWILPTWLVFEAIPSKLPHYVLPAYPAVALLTARALPALLDWAPRWKRVLFGIGAPVWLIITAGIASAAPLLRWWLDGRLDGVAIAAACVMLAFAVGALYLLRNRRQAQAFAAFGVAAVLVYGVGFGLALPRAEPLWLSPQIAAAVQATGGCPSPAVAAVGYAEPSLVFLVGTATKLTDSAAAAEMLLSDPCAFAVVADDADGGFRNSLAQFKAAPESVASFAGMNYSKGRRTRLTVYRVAARPADEGGGASLSP